MNLTLPCWHLIVPAPSVWNGNPSQWWKRGGSTFEVQRDLRNIRRHFALFRCDGKWTFQLLVPMIPLSSYPWKEGRNSPKCTFPFLCAIFKTSSQRINAAPLNTKASKQGGKKHCLPLKSFIPIAFTSWFNECWVDLFNMGDKRYQIISNLIYLDGSSVAVHQKQWFLLPGC